MMDILGVRNSNMGTTMVPEMKANFTSNINLCKEHIMKILDEERSNLDPSLVGRLICIIINNNRHQALATPSHLILNAFMEGSSTSWNSKVFVSAIKQMAPSLNWVDVLTQLDQPLFSVRSKHALQLLTQIFLEAFDSDYGRMHLISQNLYRIWNVNKAGQLSWIAQILQNSDIFSFADFPHRPVNCSTLKGLPDDNNKDIGNWRCIELIELLLRLSELSHLYQTVCALLKPPGPISMCPDVLILGLVQVPPPITQLRVLLIKQLLPLFIMGHANTVPVLNAIWNADSMLKPIVKQHILQAFLDYYGSGEDQTRLTRILEIAHELKPNGLTELFNLNQFPFVIDLACLAARRDFLKLDKFLDDKINEHGDIFAQAISFFMKKKCPMGLKAPGAIPERDAQTLLSALQLRASYSTVVANELNQLTAHFRNLQLKYEELLAHRANMPNLGANNQASYNPLLGSVSSANSAFANIRQDASSGGQFLSRLTVGSSQFPTNSIPTPTDPTKSLFSVLSNNPLGSVDALRTSPQLRNPQMGSYTGNVPFRTPSSSLSGWGNGSSSMSSNSGATTPFGFKSQLPMNRDPFSTTPLPGVTQSRPDVLGGLNPSQNRVDENNFAAMQFSDDIQEAANRYFQQIYAKCDSMTIQDFIQKLKSFKNSPDQRDKDILMCIIKNLFDEYRFFHEYPERELKTTAELYGGIIRDGIVANIQFAIALRRVIESLQSEIGSTLWNFGVVSLNACRACLFRYPKVCQMLKNIPSFERFPSPLKEYIIHGEQSQLPPSHVLEEESSVEKSAIAQTAPTSNFKVPNRGGTSILTTANVDILLNAIEKEGNQIKEPPVDVVEKVAFLCNNLSQTNLAKKTDEMKEMINENGEDFVRWLARYLVTKRVTLEQNFQPLYNNFLITLNEPLLDKCIKEETYRNIKVLLRSDKRHAASNFGDRQLLKNLGHWLGTITIARDRPILSAELDLKNLLLEAFYKGQQELLYVVPFVAKVLLSCTKSSVFAPSCSWLGGILRVLAEIHNEPDLKLNLKFEIEVLCKDLKVDLHSIETYGILKDADKLLKVPQQLGDLALLKQPDSAPIRASPMLLPSRLGGARAETPISMAGQTLAVSHVHTPVSDSEAGPSETHILPSMPPTTATLNYNDINVLSLDGLMQYLNIPTSLPLFMMHPALKHICKPAISQAIKELIGGITERAINVAITVTEKICQKDFALDPDEQNLRRASQQMMRSMTAAMASITCREPLANTIHGYLKQFFYNQLPTSTNNPNEMKLVEEAAIMITETNLEVAINFIVKTACEKATTELDKCLEREYASRRECAKEGKAFTSDPKLAEIQETLPEPIRIKHGQLTPEEMKIYDDYSSKICGFRPTRVEDMIVDFAKMRTDTGTTPMPFANEEQFQNQLQLITREVDTLLIHNQAVSMSKTFIAISELREVIHLLAKNHKDPFAMNDLITRLVDRFLFAYETNPSSELNERLRELFLGIFRVLLSQVEPNTLIRRITRAVIDCSHDYRFNADAMDIIVKHQLINVSLFDQHLKSLIESGTNFPAIYFAQKLVKLYLLDQARRHPVTNALPHTCDLLAKLQPLLAQSQMTAPVGLTPTIELGGPFGSRPASTTVNHQQEFGMPRNPNFMGTEPQMDRRLPGQDADMQQKVEFILREWIGICYGPITQREPQQALGIIVRLMHEQGVLSTDQEITRFFKLCADLCIDVSYKLLKSEQGVEKSAYVRQRCYYTLDAFVKLTCLMIKYSDGTQHATKINLLKKVLAILTQALHMDHETRQGEFNGMPFQRILISMFNELTAADPLLEPISWNILECFGQALFVVQPRRVPGFVYHWLDIVGHRNMIGKLLSDTSDIAKTGAMYTQLLLCHLKFLAPYLRNIQLTKSIQLLYRGTLRVLLVVLHDFPELLCEYHYVICDVIPPNCVQLRNLILSAYPRNMRLPDPFTQNMEAIEALSEMAENPKTHREIANIIDPTLRAKLDDYLETRSAVNFLSELPGYVQVGSTPGMKYNSSVMSAIVLYVGSKAIDAIHAKRQRISLANIAHTAYMDIFQSLAVSLCPEGRYLLFNSIANQLRYPNSHTHYFSCTLLYLFSEATIGVIQEQITRILFERLVALRPHPWGLLITFIELIRNPQYKFWDHEFVRCAPEIERIANSCSPNRQQSTSKTA